ncbi:juvenile hormone esterase-like [Uranotaenia lowii]|uniref:juvenile hormone esterase-like n=1 Tax=Uranotaenia lowii TaxID=190385 RepID=UPI0024793DBC|nr:juvenile hormone esterase-like [Uranotaenia lowii]
MVPRWSSVLIFVVTVASWIASGSCSLQIEATDSVCLSFCGGFPSVNTQEGCLCGKTVENKVAHEAFLGIPYAKPPVGELRFANPEPASPYGIYNASYPRSVCIQKNTLIPKYNFIQGDEDCLYLNVYRPQNAAGPLPVIVYIHGGEFVGNIVPTTVGADYFMASGKVLFVTIQYRLGVFGFLSTGDDAIPGNFGLKDQVMALKWVQNNIGSFGGNASQVTVFGHDAGAASIQLHMMSPLSEGLFSQAILMGGSGLSNRVNKGIQDSLSLAQDLANTVGVRSKRPLTTKQLRRSLRQADAEDLAAAVDILKYWDTNPQMIFRPVIESSWDQGSFITEDPEKLWAKGEYRRVPMMIGYSQNEGAAYTVKIMHNDALLEELINNQKLFLPALTGYSTKNMSAINKRFFEGDLMSISTSSGLIKLVSESLFLYPMIKSIKQHIANDRLPEAPIQMFQFGYQGRYSIAAEYAGEELFEYYGVCNGDDLPYLFYNFTTEPEVDTPDALVTQEFINNHIDFAVNGPTLPDIGTVAGPNLALSQQIYFKSFGNDAETEAPVVSVLGRDNKQFTELEEIYKWWSTLEA